MGLYLGNSKRKLYLNNTSFIFNIVSLTPIIKGILLKSSNDYILKDSNGLYLTAKESE